MSTALTEYVKKKKENSSFKDAIKKRWFKLRNKKNFEIIIAAVIILVVFIIYFTVKSIKEQPNQKTDVITELSANDNSIETERRLEEILSNIDKVGKVEVFISYDGNGGIVPATNTTTYKNTNSNSQSGSHQSSEQTTSSPTIVNSNGVSAPIIIEQIPPKVLGVIVVAEGANDIGVRIKLINAIMAVIKVNADSIQVFTMK